MGSDGSVPDVYSTSVYGNTSFYTLVLMLVKTLQVRRKEKVIVPINSLLVSVRLPLVTTETGHPSRSPVLSPTVRLRLEVS